MRFLIIKMLAWFNSLVNIYRFKKASGIFRKFFFLRLIAKTLFIPVKF